jgi:hypothetical protein
MARTNYLDLYFLSAGYRLAPRARSGHLPPSRPVEHYHQVCDINIRGVLLSMKHEIPAMLRSGGVPSSITPPPQATSAFRAPRFMPPQVRCHRPIVCNSGLWFAGYSVETDKL